MAEAPAVLQRPRLVAATPESVAVPPKDRTLIGVGALLLSTVLFPLSDMLSKTLAETYSGLEVAWMRYVVLLAVLLPVAARRPALFRTARPSIQILRGITSAAATSLALVGFMFLPVADATAIGFCAPLIVTGLAALILKETVGWQRWVAAAVGFAGILVIVQPGGAFQIAMALPLVSSLFSAGTVITTRLSRTERVETTMLISTVVGFALMSVLILPVWKTPDGHAVLIGLLMGLLAAAASILQVLAYSRAPASLLASFSYVQILWAVLIGWLAFGTVPGCAMLVGSAIVIGSGASVALGERRKPKVAGHRNWMVLRRELLGLHPASRTAI